MIPMHMDSLTNMCAHASKAIGVFTTRGILFRAGVITCNLDKMIVCQYFSESCSHELEIHAA